MECKYSHSLPEKIEWIEVRPNWRCDARCKHCAAWTLSELGSDDFLCASRLATTLSSLGSLVEVDAYIYGGEPFLNKNLPSIIKLLAEKCKSVEIVTNGHCLQNDMVNVLMENKNNIIVCVSLDGLEVLHDENRGVESFSKAGIFIDKLNKIGIRVKVRTVITKNNYEYIDANFFKYLKNISVFTIEVGGMYFNNDWIQSAVSTKNIKLHDWSHEYLNCRDKNGEFYNYVKDTIDKNTSWVDDLDIVFLGFPPQMELTASVCSVEDSCFYQNGIVVEPDGRVLRCPFLPTGVAIEKGETSECY